jgi:perosamine synthetase
VAEEMNDTSYLGFGMCTFSLSDDDVDLIIEAFHKVWAHKVAHD